MDRTDHRHTHVLLLRGVNVGGRNRVPKAELAELAAEAGAEDATVLLNSGNVLCRIGERRPAAEREIGLQGFEAGGIDYVTKPLKTDEVLARVAAHLRTARELQAARSLPASRPHARTALDLAPLSSRYQLTGREVEVLHWVACGKTNRDIGDILGLSPRTVNKHLEHVYVKLGVETRTAAASVALAAMSERA